MTITRSGDVGWSRGRCGCEGFWIPPPPWTIPGQYIAIPCYKCGATGRRKFLWFPWKCGHCNGLGEIIYGPAPKAGCYYGEDHS